MEKEKACALSREKALRRDNAELVETIEAIVEHLERKRILDEKHKLVDKMRIGVKRWSHINKKQDA